MRYASTDDLITLWRKLSREEVERANALIPIVEDSLRVEAQKAGKNLDQLAKENQAYAQVVKSVVVDVVARTLMTRTEGEPMTQESQSALGYSWSGSYLVPGGGLFIKRSELDRLGLRRQRYGVLNWYETPRHDGLSGREAEDWD